VCFNPLIVDIDSSNNT